MEHPWAPLSILSRTNEVKNEGPLRLVLAQPELPTKNARLPSRDMLHFLVATFLKKGESRAN